MNLKFIGCLVKELKWICPDLGRVELNSDGCKDNPGYGGGGCLLRSDTGALIWAWANLCTNMKAEALALLRGLKLCLGNGFSKVEVESDSMVLVHANNNKMHPPWAISYDLLQILGILGRTEFLLEK